MFYYGYCTHGRAQIQPMESSILRKEIFAGFFLNCYFFKMQNQKIFTSRGYKFQITNFTVSLSSCNGKQLKFIKFATVFSITTKDGTIELAYNEHHLGTTKFVLYIKCLL
eukprot:TRINITY_DN9249_c0_g1_i1.p7 TRINITY_DN9249_c0_g1~~TRINITY_DN9249_c0_g1_i1.p7  ORF type:complete len:110 (-),score=2.86 TRINITY_DN9249_c0_g1_i1:378-707(-)